METEQFNIVRLLRSCATCGYAFDKAPSRRTLPTQSMTLWTILKQGRNLLRDAILDCGCRDGLKSLPCSQQSTGIWETVH